MVLKSTRRRSEPLMEQLKTLSGLEDASTHHSEDGKILMLGGSSPELNVASLEYEESPRRPKRLVRLDQNDDVDDNNNSMSQFVLHKHEKKILLTWKEIATGTLLLCAFGACGAVFVLLQQQQQQQQEQHEGTGFGSVSECEARSALQQRLVQFMVGNQSTSAALALLAEGVSVSTGDLAEAGSCTYNVQICPHSHHNSDDETIMYILLIGAILTVVGVSVLLYDDKEEKILKMSMRDTEVQRRRGSMNSSVHSIQHTRMGNADFFPDCSVLCADIVGFEAWSSIREPSQCLDLLETIYDALDSLAKKQGIFKVESTVDHYTVATGLPEPSPDHAEMIVRFANDCLKNFTETTKRLEVSLGPDTSDLHLRIGIHSGPVTAIRRQSRYHLFGETVTGANNIMKSSMVGRILMSQESVAFLPIDVRDKWVSARESVKGMKGSQEAETYWLLSSALAMSDESKHQVSSHNNLAASKSHDDEKIERLVEWNVQILKRVLNQMATKRRAARTSAKAMDETAIDKKLRDGKSVVDEVMEVIQLPKFQNKRSENRRSRKDVHVPVEVSDEVVSQLRDFITAIAKTYKTNPFHNFEHASHVTMSVSKLLSRILAPKIDNRKDHKCLHDHTYGITSDPLTQFACIFSALIHDAEHEGVPNAQLVKEETALAAKYNNQSVAEQNSLDVGWNLLMKSRFKELRSAIYTSEEEMVHFRHLIVNCVMATDICDKQLKDLRNKRWDRAFKIKPDASADELAMSPEVMENDVNRKATIVIEHLMQASDVSHTMQHFNVYRKWNENLFNEMYFAYRDGRSAADPSKFWYKGEIGFFDFYLIPLAKKLKDCGVFGVSSDEYLNYAIRNRQEWTVRGEQIVESLIAKATKAYEERQRANGEGKQCNAPPSA